MMPMRIAVRTDHVILASVPLAKKKDRHSLGWTKTVFSEFLYLLRSPLTTPRALDPRPIPRPSKRDH